MHENCGVAAVIDLAGEQDVVPLAVAMAQELQHRGELGAGIAWLNKKNEIQILKDHGTVARVLNPERIQAIGASGCAAIAHTRYATNALLDQCMVQPYQYFEHESPQEFAFAFNGNIANHAAQNQRLIESGNAPLLEGDTEIIGRTIIASMKENTKQKMSKVLRTLGHLDGAYNIVMLQKNGTISALRDRNGFHPLTYARKGSLLAVASEDNAIRRIWSDATVQDVEPGYLIQVLPDRKEVTHDQLWMPERSHCFFETVYFADHRSRIDGTSVANARYECGKILAEMDSGRPASDIVVPVPESAKIAANGYADTRRLRRVDGILKHENVGRTFISPSDRAAKAACKYNIDGALLSGRSIILIDDSLVRGTTMHVLAQQLRAKGVTEIHLRLASPPIISPCFYGIDFPTIQELLVRKHTDGTLKEDGELPEDVLRAIAVALEVDSIKYLASGAIPRAIGRDQGDMCMACVTKKYPTEEGRRLALQAESQKKI